MPSQFPKPDAEKHETLRTGLESPIDVHVNTWYCQTCGRAIGQDYALKGWNYYKKIICPDCLQASRQEVI